MLALLSASLSAATLVPGQSLQFTVAAVGTSGGWATIEIDASGVHLTPLAAAAAAGANAGDGAAGAAGRRRLLAAAAAAASNASNATTSGSSAGSLLGVGSLQSFSSAAAGGGSLAAGWAAGGAPVMLGRSAGARGALRRPLSGTSCVVPACLCVVRPAGTSWHSAASAQLTHSVLLPPLQHLCFLWL